MKILFIGARLYHGVVDYVQEKGINSIMSESNPDSPNLKLPDKVHIMPRGMDAPMELAIKEHVDAVLPLIGIDGPLMDVGKMKNVLEKEYGIPVVASNESAASMATSKIKTKDFFAKNKINTPSYQIISNSKNSDKTHVTDFLASKSSKIKFPCVLKQSEGQGGVGIMVAKNKEDVETYFQKYDEAIIEQFIDGFEISVEVLRWNGKSVPLAVVCKGKTTLKCLHPLDKMKYAPADIPGLSNELARDLALKITNLMGSEGNTDVDMIFEPSSGKLYAIEMNTRPSGTRYLTAASSDINPLNEMVDMALGKWDVNDVKNRMKNYYSLEIPVGEFKGPNCDNSSQNFTGSDSWVVHGPKNYERVTIRGKDQKSTYKTAEMLKIDLNKF
ncbi:MAG: ATP-grasp domain-containing protein [Methanobacteriaceae archaeon]|nr:ATP-grasp domain-containing protein [Methanobacteriaceae archaeon]